MAARVLLVLAVVFAAWAFRLTVGGGFDLTVGGRTVTSNDPVRPFVLASLAFIGYALLTGIGPVRDRWARVLGRIGDHRLALLISLGITLLGIAYSATAGIASDAYGYVSQADLWARRDLFIPEPWISAAPWPEPQWTFAPLGYRPVALNDAWAFVPIYSPGLPLLMALAKFVGGQESLFWIVPMSGGVLAWMTFGIGQRLGSSRAGLIASWLVATSPAVLMMLMQPMSDVPVAAAWATAIFFALGGRTKDAAVSGLATSLAILIRPNLSILAGPLLIWWLIRRDLNRESPHMRDRMKSVIVYAICVLPGVATTALIYNALYGSPVTSGYGDVSAMFAWQHIPRNAARYLKWFTESHGHLAVVGLVALVLPIRLIWSWVPDRRAPLMIAGCLSLLVLQYLAYVVFDDWSFIRFLLTAWPFVMLGIAAVALALARPQWPVASFIVSAAIVALGIQGIQHSRTSGIFGIWHHHRRPVELARLLSKEVPASSVVYSLQHSGTLRYYGGLTTLRTDLLAPDWLDRSVAWLRARGVSAYLLLEDGEVEPFKKRYAGQSIADTLDARLSIVYGSPTPSRFYDLNGALPSTPRVIDVGNLHELRSAEPDPRAFAPQLAPARRP